MVHILLINIKLILIFKYYFYLCASCNQCNNLYIHTLYCYIIENSILNNGGMCKYEFLSLFKKAEWIFLLSEVIERLSINSGIVMKTPSTVILVLFSVLTERITKLETEIGNIH